MEINKTSTSQIDLYKRFHIEQTPSRATTPSSQAQSADSAHMDTVSVSDEAVLRTAAYRAAMNAHDTRQEKIDAIKGRLANGTYQIDSRKVASSTLNMEKALLVR